MPLEFLWCDFRANRDAGILKSIRTLRVINDLPVAEFWKKHGVSQPPWAASWPAWDGKETIAAYAARAKVPPTQDLDLGGGVKMEFVLIPAGTFTMGGTEAPREDWQGDERPPHRVKITGGFYLGKYEVTRGQFAAFVSETGYKTDVEKEGKARGRRADAIWGEIPGANWKDPVVFRQTDGHPAMCISWNDTEAFCRWLAEKTKRRVRLPTEAEWEYACRAGTTTAFHYGSALRSGMANFDGRYEYDASSGEANNPSGIHLERTTTVGSYAPNSWGLYDMHGNVYQWCQDWHADYLTGILTQPPTRIYRGGAWDMGGSLCRSAQRLSDIPPMTFNDVGFRVVLAAAQP
jgi:formylglycine-generating enzyme required for sulfatase activity